MGKVALDQVLQSEIMQASNAWHRGTPFNVIAFELDWSEELLNRVIRLCREFEDADLFPHRKPRAPAKHDVRKVPEVVRPVSLSNTRWQQALAASGTKPSTVRARRVASIRPQDIHRMRQSSLPIGGGQLG